MTSPDLLSPEFEAMIEEALPCLHGCKAEGHDWIIRGVRGEFYPCKPDIFDATYEPVP